MRSPYELPRVEAQEDRRRIFGRNLGNGYGGSVTGGQRQDLGGEICLLSRCLVGGDDHEDQVAAGGGQVIRGGFRRGLIDTVQQLEARKTAGQLKAGTLKAVLRAIYYQD